MATIVLLQLLTIVTVHVCGCRVELGRRASGTLTGSRLAGFLGILILTDAFATLSYGVDTGQTNQHAGTGGASVEVAAEGTGGGA